MKSLKAAVVVAGSVILAGVAAPAFATPADLTPTSLNGAVDTLARGPVNVEDALPLQHQSDALDTENEDSVLHTVNGVAEALNTHNPLLGGLPLQG
ncbi:MULTISPECIES: hypothetical protein [Streptomyces]|uniref:Secreted protein n=1 Tax=Streptomyces achromogenes TaxID=67255 RepID=A0ABU0PZV4_STRAH|nr:hypothetical protein [Streptomyces achromogenes]MDQ0683945.1 hypothetical protein [Streptomyces achromogenes]MDQ0831055.1 hypothetical protein [Streptomyces achromogenes]